MPDISTEDLFKLLYFSPNEGDVENVIKQYPDIFKTKTGLYCYDKTSIQTFLYSDNSEREAIGNSCRKTKNPYF
ncbi:hypothetical protein [Chryseobacterium sp. EZn1]|uniref:hypothetical protein n=1 Tax=Chryseobacterium cupriresistens TaxID=3366770 RepID=UPI0039854B14